MKELTMFYFAGCPHCRRAFDWIEELKREDAALAAVPIRKIDEKLQPEIADRYDYWYVPTFFLGEKKLHEGAASKEIIESVLREAAGTAENEK